MESRSRPGSRDAITGGGVEIATGVGIGVSSHHSSFKFLDLLSTPWLLFIVVLGIPDQAGSSDVTTKTSPLGFIPITGFRP